MDQTFNLGTQAYGMILDPQTDDQVLVISHHQIWGAKEQFGYMDAQHWTILPFAMLHTHTDTDLVQERVGLIDDKWQNHFCHPWNT